MKKNKYFVKEKKNFKLEVVKKIKKKKIYLQEINTIITLVKSSYRIESG